MKNALMFLILSVSVIMFSAQFEIAKDVTELPGDITAARSPHKDVNGKWCAIVKVHTDVKGIRFEGDGYEKHNYLDESGIYIVYLQENTKNLRFLKDGFDPLSHNFSFRLKSNTVYQIDIIGKGDQKQIDEIMINILGHPEKAVIFLDGKELGEITSVKTSLGEHDLRVIKKGYKDKSMKIKVSPDNTAFNYELEEIDLAAIAIDSDPQGADVFIEGIKVGVTPLKSFYKPGMYRIKLSGDFCTEFEENLEIAMPSTEKSYKLDDIRATLSILTHQLSRVFINEKEIRDFKNIKLSPQMVKIRVENPKATQPAEKSVILRPRETKEIEIYPEMKTGALYVKPFPEDAEVEVWIWRENTLRSTGKAEFKDLIIGEYRYKISKPGYWTKRGKVTIKESLSEQINDSLIEGDEYVFVEGGKFKMGGYTTYVTTAEPVHEVIVKSFYIKKHEVTEAEYEEVMKGSVSEKTKGEFPAAGMGWYEAVKFCNRLSEAEGYECCYDITGTYKHSKDKTEYIVKWNDVADGYRLPTEAEWEFAARGGNLSKGYKYSGTDYYVEDYAWIPDNSDYGSKYVGTKKPNELGIFDMSGNVSEWCWDLYDYYKSFYASVLENPKGPENNTTKSRVNRGGSYYFGGAEVFARTGDNPEKGKYIGIRVVRNAEKKE